MKKEFEYKGYSFIILVDFNTEQERGINGSVTHTVICHSTEGDNYYKEEFTADVNLEERVKGMEEEAKIYVDKKERLMALGFE